MKIVRALGAFFGVEVSLRNEKTPQQPTVRRRIAEAFPPTATLLEHTLPAQGFMGTSKAVFPRRLRPQNRDSTWANLLNALK